MEPEHMTDEEVSPEDAFPEEDEEKKPEEKMSTWFYITLAIIGFLVIMILVVNIPGTKSSAVFTMTQGNWTLESYVNESGSLVPVLTGSEVTAKFDRAGLLSGRSGCNGYSAAYTVKNYEIAISDVVHTDMACLDPGIMMQEKAYLNDIQRSTILGVNDVNLKFYDTEGKLILVYRNL